ncbi:MAG TPA: SIS domain-containing protein [Fimbriimonadaceae bacterium]|nr:SIS domain-containing protein [Fimbriimonadaceae bacterium]HRJ95645.1 SIS domain-containing protein [Fimbriimonadaceae bacterium]
MTERLLASLDEAAEALRSFRQDQERLEALTGIAELLVETLRAGRKVIVCGNGGSMADAMHFAEEWTGRFRADRRPLAVIALSDPAHITCVANDYGFEEVFARMVQALGRPGDVLILLSTSGRSANLVRAALAARAAELKVIGFLGRDGGDLLPICDRLVVMPGKTPDRIQELHMLALHCLIEIAEPCLAES